MKIVVVGAGISGLSSAVVCREKGHDVEVFERRHYVGGLCADDFRDGLVFQYHGPHVFHTNHRDTVDFIKRYTSLYPFEHIVMARTEIGMFPIPFSPLSEKIVGDLSPRRIRDLVFRGYSEKQWGKRWDDLPRSIKERVSFKRNTVDPRYTLDEWQGVPVGGYAKMFEAMAEGITVHLNVDTDVWRSQKADIVIYTGRLDEYFNCCHGELGYRSVRFIHRREPVRKYPIINECMTEVPWTRSTDHSHWNGATDLSKTTVTYEYPCDTNCGEPLYPLLFGPSVALVEKYRKMASLERNVYFMGRMAEHRYVDMHVAVKRVLERLT